MKNIASQKSGSRGRPTIEPVVMAKRIALRAKSKLQEIQTEFNAMLCLDPGEEQTRRGSEVLAVAAERVKKARELEKVKAALRENRAALKEKGISGSAREQLKAQRAGLKSEEKQKTDELYNLPELGSTQYEQDEAGGPLHFIGRPPLSIELKLVRMENEYQQAAEALRQMELSEGIPPTDLAKTNETVESKSGRQKLDPIGQLDRRARAIERLIEEIDAGKIRPTKRKLSSRGVPMGRYSKSPEEKRADAVKELAEVMAKIAKKESKLSEVGMMKRKLKHARDERRHVRIEAKSAKSKAKKALLAREKKLDIIIDKLLSSIAEASKPSEKERKKKLASKQDAAAKREYDERNDKAAILRERLAMLQRQKQGAQVAGNKSMGDFSSAHRH